MSRYRLLLVVLSVSLALGACGWGGQPPAANNPDAASAPEVNEPEAGDPVTISFLAQEWERSRYQPLIDRFNEENPDVRVQYISHDEVEGAGFDNALSPEQRMRRVVSAADTATAFAISAEYITNGYLFDLAPLMDADPTFARDDFYPGALESVSQDGGVYMLPSSMYISLLSYNQELWAAAGLSEPDPNWSWQDMIGAAEQLAQTRGNEVEVYGYAGSGSGFTPLLAEAAQAGIDLYATPAEALDLQQPAFVAALERVAALAESGAVFVDAEADGPSSIEDQKQRILTGQAGIWNAEVLFWGAEDEEPQFEIGTAPFPVLAGRQFANTQGYIMSSGTQYPQQAWRWLEFLSRQELDDDFGPEQMPNQLPARESVADTSGYWAALDDETATAVRAMLERPAQPLDQDTFSGVNVFEPLTEALQGVIRGDQAAEAALHDAQASLDEQLAEAQQTSEVTPETGPIVVNTPIAEVVADGATQISFGISQFRPGNMRQVVREFNQNSPDVFVDINEIDTAEGPLKFSDIANTSDCFEWGVGPGRDEITATLDLQPLIDADASFDSNDYPPALLESFQHEAGLYGLPYTFTARTLNYNQTAFDAAGLDYPTADWTLDDFLNAAEQLTTGEGHDQQYGYISLGSQTSELRFFLRRAGVELAQGRGEAAQLNFTSPEVIQATQSYVDLLRDFSPETQFQGYVGNSVIIGGDSYNLIREGRAGMWFDFGFAFFDSSMDNNTDVRLAVAPPPFGESAVGPQDIYPGGLYISATTQHREACWTWLKHLSADVSALEGSFPARISVAESAEFAEQTRLGAAEVFAAYRDAMARSPTNNDEDETPNGVPIDYFWFFQAVDQAFQGEADLEQGLAEAQQITEEYMVCVRSGGEGAELTCPTQVDPDYDGRQQPPEAEEETDEEE